MFFVIWLSGFGHGGSKVHQQYILSPGLGHDPHQLESTYVMGDRHVPFFVVVSKPNQRETQESSGESSVFIWLYVNVYLP